MDKVLSFFKNSLAGFLDLLLHPVSKVSETVQREDIKKSGIKALILAVVVAIVKVLSTIRASYIVYTKDSWREAAMEDFNPFVSFLKYTGVYLLVIVAVALVLFIIAKIVKDEKPLPYTLSMAVNSGAVYVVGSVIGLIFSFWTPLAMLVIKIAALHSGLTLVISFVSSLSNVNTDQLALVTTVVLTVVVIIMAIVHLITNDTDLNKYADSEYVDTTKLEEVVLAATKNK